MKPQNDDSYLYWLTEEQDRLVDNMMFPVRCICGQVYDTAAVTVTARYSDCSVWKAPCCGRVADDRFETGWSTVRHYYPMSSGGAS